MQSVDQLYANKCRWLLLLGFAGVTIFYLESPLSVVMSNMIPFNEDPQFLTVASTYIALALPPLPNEPEGDPIAWGEKLRWRSSGESDVVGVSFFLYPRHHPSQSPTVPRASALIFRIYIYNIPVVTPANVQTFASTPGPSVPAGSAAPTDPVNPTDDSSLPTHTGHHGGAAPPSLGHQSLSYQYTPSHSHSRPLPPSRPSRNLQVFELECDLDRLAPLEAAIPTNDDANFQLHRRLLLLLHRLRRLRRAQSWSDMPVRPQAGADQLSQWPWRPDVRSLTPPTSDEDSSPPRGCKGKDPNRRQPTTTVIKPPLSPDSPSTRDPAWPARTDTPWIVARPLNRLVLGRMLPFGQSGISVLAECDGREVVVKIALGTDACRSLAKEAAVYNRIARGVTNGQCVKNARIDFVPASWGLFTPELDLDLGVDGAAPAFARDVQTGAAAAASQRQSDEVVLALITDYAGEGLDGRCVDLNGMSDLDK